MVYKGVNCLEAKSKNQKQQARTKSCYQRKKQQDEFGHQVFTVECERCKVRSHSNIYECGNIRNTYKMVYNYMYIWFVAKYFNNIKYEL